MGFIKELFRQFKRGFTGSWLPEDRAKDTIEIRGSRRADAPRDDRPSDAAPKIKIIGGIHRYKSEAIKDVYRSEVDVVDRKLGKGITLNSRSKPGKCPLCATQGKVTANVGGGDRWKCEECGNTFD